MFLVDNGNLLLYSVRNSTPGDFMNTYEARFLFLCRYGNIYRIKQAVNGDWFVMDCSDGLVVVTSGNKSAAEAVDVLMAYHETEEKLWNATQ